MKFFTILTFSLILLFATGCKEQEKDRYLLVPTDYTSANFLKQWNEATVNELQLGFPHDSLFRQLYIENLLNDSLGFPAATRGKLLSIIHDQRILPDSIWYNTFYIIETRYEGEYNFYVDYLILDRSPADYYYKFKSGRGLWRLIETAEGDFSYTEQLYEILSSKKHDSSRVARSARPIIITKVNPDTLITIVIFQPTEEQMSSISTFDKLVGVTEDNVL